MVKGKAAAISVRIPQNREEAASMISEYGAALREVERIETDMNADLLRIKETAEASAKVHADKAVEIFKGLQLYCETNRQTLLGDTGLKTVDFGTGKAAWRWKPSKVSITGGEDLVAGRIAEKEAAAIALGQNGVEYRNFLRISVKIDREAMLKNPDLARTIEGVKIGRAGETFEIEPFGAEISEAAA